MFVIFHLFHFLPNLPLSSKSSAEEMEEMSFFHFLPPVRKKVISSGRNSTLCIGDKEICDMWQTHYKQLLISVVTSSSKKIVQSELHSIADSSVIFCPVDIFNALKNAKTGKACGVDGLAAEHFIYADAIIHIHLSLLFNSFISHGYLPRDFMKTAIVPIIKNKSGIPVIKQTTDQLH